MSNRRERNNGLYRSDRLHSWERIWILGRGYIRVEYQHCLTEISVQQGENGRDNRQGQGWHLYQNIWRQIKKRQITSLMEYVWRGRDDSGVFPWLPAEYYGQQLNKRTMVSLVCGEVEVIWVVSIRKPLNNFWSACNSRNEKGREVSQTRLFKQTRVRTVKNLIFLPDRCKYLRGRLGSSNNPLDL